MTIPSMTSPFFTRFSRTIFLITEKGIRMSCGLKMFFEPWARIKGYWLSQHEQFPELTMVTLQLKKWKRTLILPEDEQADKIIGTISQRIPKVDLKEPVDRPRTSLTKLQYIYLVILTLVYLIFFTYVILKTGSRNVQLAFVLLALLLGPGTLGSIHMFGKKSFKDNGIKEAAVISILLLLGLFFFSQFCIYIITSATKSKVPELIKFSFLKSSNLYTAFQNPSLPARPKRYFDCLFLRLKHPCCPVIR